MIRVPPTYSDKKRYYKRYTRKKQVKLGHVKPVLYFNLLMSHLWLGFLNRPLEIHHNRTVVLKQYT